MNPITHCEIFWHAPVPALGHAPETDKIKVGMVPQNSPPAHNLLAGLILQR